MNITGLVVEYNPFHNGHMYHLKKSKQITGSTGVVAVMSGNWVQRGEPAIIDKWSRAKIALENGVDLVIELPVIWSLQSARQFSRGAVTLLHRLNVIDYLVFGSESANINLLKRAASLQINEDQDFKDTFKKNMSTGISYPEAIGKTLAQLGNEKLGPNDILGIEYLKTLIELNSSIKPFTIKRKGSGYHDFEIDHNTKFASATAIRKHLLEKKEVTKFIPPATSSNLHLVDKFIHFNLLEPYLFYRLRTIPSEQLSLYTGWEKGLENRVSDAAYKSTKIQDLIQYIKTKRYTRSRINRYLLHVLLHLEHNVVAEFNKKGPVYARVLGMNNTGRNILNKIKENSTLPIIIRPGRDLRFLDDNCRICFNIEVRATALYNLLQNKEALDEYTRQLIII